MRLLYAMRCIIEATLFSADRSARHPASVIFDICATRPTVRYMILYATYDAPRFSFSPLLCHAQQKRVVDLKLQDDIELYATIRICYR